MPAPKKPAAKKASTKKTAAKKTVKKTPAKKKPTLKKSTSKKTAVKADAKPLIKHTDATIIRVNKPSASLKPEPRTITIEPKAKTFTHKVSPLGEQIGGASEFERDKATPRLKIQPGVQHQARKSIEGSDYKLLDSHFTDTENMPIAEQSAPVHEEGSLPEVSLVDPAPANDPFSDILDHIEDEEREKDAKNVQRKTTVQADPVAKPSSRNLVDEIENPKPFDTKHYHVPIRSRAAKSAATYGLEFIIIMALIVAFIVLLIDAELIETSFQLPFDVV